SFISKNDTARRRRKCQPPRSVDDNRRYHSLRIGRPGSGSMSDMGIFRQLPIGALFEPRATIPSCSISAIRKQVATGSSILRGQLLRYSLFGGCCDSMCCSGRRHARNNQISRYTGARVLSVMAMLQQLSKFRPALGKSQVAENAWDKPPGMIAD